MSMARRVALLVTLWLLAWGELSLANVLSGTAVAAALLLAFPARRRGVAHLHPSVIGLARLAGYIAKQLVVSNIVMTRQILRRRPEVAPGVVAHRLGTPSEEVLTFMTSIIALSPGTIAVDVTHDSSVVYVHFFRLKDLGAAHASLKQLEGLVVNAIAANRPNRSRSRSLKEKP
jgi:multicomponent Na+:H+ antiporter subunit E